jgi:serine phosphatase RsbU (regulator of sigma subunit)/putative methionine-R-sulfoxide reductase with GAF domain
VGLFEGDAYLVKLRVQDGERQTGETYSHGGRQGIVGWVRDTGMSLLVHDFESERDSLPAFPPFHLDTPPRSGLFVPLIAGTETIGILAIQSYQVGRFGEKQRRLLTALANHGAWAIRNAQLYENTRYRAEQLNLVRGVLASVSSLQPLPDLFRQIVTLIKDTFGYYCVSIFTLYDRMLSVGASTNEMFGRSEPLEVGQGMVGWSARQGQTALANNVAEDPRYRKAGVLPETRSEIALPLKVEGRVLGVLDVQSNREDGFKEDDVFLLEALAAQIALAIEQAETYAAEYRLRRRLEALVQVSQAVVSVLDLDELLERQVELIAETFDFERVHIFVRLGETLVFRAGTGPHSVRWLVEGLAYDLDEPGLIPEVARTSQAELVGDVSRSPDYRPGPDVGDTRSEIAIPIGMADRVMGVLDVQSTEENAFDREDLVLLGSLADSIAVAIRNAALYANERRRRNLADALREASASLAAELDYDRVIADVLEGLRRVVNLQTAAIFLFDRDAGFLTVYATAENNLTGFAGYRLSLDVLGNGEAAEKERALHEIFYDLLNVPRDQPVLSVPLSVGGDQIGAVVVDQPHHWMVSASDYEIVAAFANQAAIAISNSRLYAAQQAEAYVTTVLLQVAEAVNPQADVSEALDTIARLTALLAGVNRCLIMRYEPDTSAYYVTAQYGISRKRYNEWAGVPIEAGQYPLLDLLTVADRHLGAGQGYQIPVPEPLSSMLQAQAVLCIPLRARGGPLGLLVVDDPRRKANPRLLAILGGIAHQTASLLETAKLQTSALERDRLEQELQVARSIQASFIPDKLPQIPGWEIAAAWQSARQVSGDFYDFIPLPDGLWGLVMADVADKGTPAALFMAVCRTLLRAVAISRTSPAGVLKRVNELIFNDSRSDLFVTVFYAVWHPETGVVSYASGGHNASLWVRQTDEVVELQAKGIALGVIPEIDIDEHEITLHPGEMIIAYTDGVTEAMQDDFTEWGLPRLKDTAKAVAAGSAQNALDRILEEVTAFVGGAPQNDDLTIWLLKRSERGS